MRWLAVLLLVALSACRKDQPPRLSVICIGDGVGGASCVDSANKRFYLPPSKLKNYWMTTSVDIANFSSWCYGGAPSDAKEAMKDIRSDILR